MTSSTYTYIHLRRAFLSNPEFKDVEPETICAWYIVRERQILATGRQGRNVCSSLSRPLNLPASSKCEESWLSLALQWSLLFVRKLVYLKYRRAEDKARASFVDHNNIHGINYVPSTGFLREGRKS